MTKLDPDEAVTRARHAIGAPVTIKAHAWHVERLDRIGETYYLVVFGDDQAATAIAAIDASTGEAIASARLPGSGPHIAVDAVSALRIANVGNADVKLVWRACGASLSPLYPFWCVSGPTRTVFVDQQRNCWDHLSSRRA